MWVSGAADVLLDSFSISGPHGESGPVAAVTVGIAPDQYPGIYDIGNSASFTLRARTDVAADLVYEITDPLHATLVDSGVLGHVDADRLVHEFSLPVATGKRGYYVLRARLDDGVTAGDWSSRSFVVIDPVSPRANDPFFGLCSEESGIHSKIDAFVTPDYMYQLMERIGAGSVRIFTPASPDVVSADGVDYSFSELDSSLDLSAKYGLEPLVILGTNSTDRIPDWLRTRKPKAGDFDLTDGQKSSRLHGGNYFDLSAYAQYLERLMQHSAQRDVSYSLWNEPGNKFAIADFLGIASTTRQVQQQWTPGARLVGYSSSTRQDNGRGTDPAALPSYINAVAQQGGLSNIDTLSYHSPHVFNFMGKNYDRRDHETGFASRLRQIISAAGAGPLPIWDTERGIPWFSPHTERIDAREGRARTWMSVPRACVPDQWSMRPCSCRWSMRRPGLRAWSDCSGSISTSP